MVRHRVNEQLKRDMGAAAGLRHEADHGCQVTAGAIAPHGDRPAAGAKGLGVICCPAGGGVAVFRGGGEGVLWRQAVIDRHHDAARLSC